MQSLELNEQQSASVAKSHNTRVSLDDIKSNIAAEYTFRADTALQQAPIHDTLKLLTICILVTKNGFSVVGKSAPADPKNFDEELGRKFAKEDAMRQLWPLMGFELRERMMRAA